MEIQNAFDLVADKVEKALAEQDYKRQNVDSQNDKEITALYTSEDTAYNIVYYKAKMRMVLRQCEMSGAEPDNNWKSVATWLFDPEVDTEKEADNIASDFIETIQGPKQQAITQTRKKKKKDNDGNVDSLFLANRMVNYFPELKEDMKNCTMLISEELLLLRKRFCHFLSSMLQMRAPIILESFLSH